MSTRNPHTFHNISVRILVDSAVSEIIEARDMNRTGIDDRPFDQAAPGKLCRMPKAIGCLLLPQSRTRNGGIDNDINLGTDAFDDARIDFPIIFLAARGDVICVSMNDGSARLGTGDAVGDDLLDGDGNARLALARPRSVQRGFDPDFGHRHFPVQTGLRFSANAASPSLASCVIASTAICDSV